MQINPLKSDAVLKEKFIKAYGESKKHIFALIISLFSVRCLFYIHMIRANPK
jgi:hypothetical protein